LFHQNDEPSLLLSAVINGQKDQRTQNEAILDALKPLPDFARTLERLVEDSRKQQSLSASRRKSRGGRREDGEGGSDGDGEEEEEGGEGDDELMKSKRNQFLVRYHAGPR
jgi:hypothetical protein